MNFQKILQTSDTCAIIEALEVIMVTENYIKPEEYAERFRIHINTVYNLIKAGQIKAIRIGDQWRIPQSTLPDNIKEE